MAALHDEVQINGKTGAEHVEGEKHVNDVILKSSHDTLGVWATVKKFKKVGCYVFSVTPSLLTELFKAILVCNLLCIAAGADGFQTTLNGEKYPAPPHDASW